MRRKYPLNNAITSHVVSMRLDLEQATTLIVERARQLVNKLIEQRGHDKPPFLPQEFTRLMGIKPIVKAELGQTSAVLLRFQDGYVIKVNEKHHPVRQNFSCAHEIGHTLFSELKLERYTNTIEYRRFDPEGERKARSRAVERLCDAAAAELLMPEIVFKKYLSGFGLSVDSIERLASVFRVSVQAAAIRIAEVGTEPCLTLLWQPWRRTKSEGLRSAWCVGPESNRQGRGYYIPLHNYVRPPSTLHKAYEGKCSVKSFRRFKIGNSTRRLPTESKSFGSGETRYVISLAFLDR